MLNHEKVQDAPLTAGEIFEFASAVVEQLPRDLDPAKVRWYNEKKGRIGKEIRPLFARPMPAFDIAWWEGFYQKHFGLALDHSMLHVPAKPEYACRPVLVVPQINNNQVFDACTKAFKGKAWRYEDDLNTVTDIVERPQGPYVVWVHDTVEADADMANKSAEDIAAAGTNTMTLRERMVLELAYFDETGKHLDIENVTLCAGSRYRGGRVPHAHWLGEFGVGWCHPRRRYPSLRARVAVS